MLVLIWLVKLFFSSCGMLYVNLMMLMLCVILFCVFENILLCLVVMIVVSVLWCLFISCRKWCSMCVWWIGGVLV